MASSISPSVQIERDAGGAVRSLSHGGPRYGPPANISEKKYYAGFLDAQDSSLGARGECFRNGHNHRGTVRTILCLGGASKDSLPKWVRTRFGCASRSRGVSKLKDDEYTETQRGNHTCVQHER
jgi:hypothetical protein